MAFTKIGDNAKILGIVEAEEKPSDEESRHLLQELEKEMKKDSNKTPSSVDSSKS